MSGLAGFGPGIRERHQPKGEEAQEFCWLSCPIPISIDNVSDIVNLITTKVGVSFPIEDSENSESIVVSCGLGFSMAATGFVSDRNRVSSRSSTN